jgi:hypothetical protein
MFIATGSGSAESVAPGAERSFATQLSIRAGDLIAIDGPASAAAPLAFQSGGGTNSRFNPPLLEGDPARSPTGSGSGFMGMVSAQLEPDCDSDGLGDDTQDTNISSCRPAAPAAAPPPTCKGKPATIIGTPGNDVRSGTPGRDVIVGLAGNDKLSGLAGKDLLCGGTGKDKLNGGKSKDTLLGQKGRDKLKGGGGKDICKGGKGNDTASACEVEKSI